MLISSPSRTLASVLPRRSSTALSYVTLNQPRFVSTQPEARHV